MAREQSRERCLETLGLEPRASTHDIKAAYRDLAKVWHPDRFAHDPRLQQKAQEKLKEINDAYRRLLNGATSPRSRHATHDANAPRNADATCAPRRDATRAESASAQHPSRESAPHVRRKTFWLALAPVAVFCATFAFVTPRLLSSRGASPSPVAVSDAAQPSRADEVRQIVNEDSAQKSSRKTKLTDGAARVDSFAGMDKIDGGAATTPVRALPTVSVAIDPTTGLRARADCPNKMTVTFPAGDEPHAYCNAEHRRSEPGTAANGEKGADKSRLKSFAGRLASPSKWFSDNSSSAAPAKKPATQDQSRDQD
jgi:hypothetical protein